MVQGDQNKDVQITVDEESYASPVNLIPKKKQHNPTCASKLGNLPIWQRPFYEKCLFVIWVIIGIVMLCFLLTSLTAVVVTLCLLSNTLLHVFESMRGEAGRKTLVSPIRDKVATYILLSTIALLGVWVGLIQALDHRKGGMVFSGVHAVQWIEIVMVILGYYTLGTITRPLVEAYFQKPIQYWLQGLLDAACCVLLLPMVLLIFALIPTWKHHRILGLLTWKWVRATVLVVLGHTAITIAVRAGIVVSKQWCNFSKKGCKGSKCVYFYLKGLRKSITFLLVTLMHFIVWKLYFVRRINNKSWSDFGTWTFACELILGGLWLLKNFILHYWLAHSIYNRPDEQIMRKLSYWYCLHHLGLINWRGDQDQDQTAGSSDQNQQNKEKSVASIEYSRQNTKTKSVRERYMLLPAYRFMEEKIFVNTRQKIEEASNSRREKLWNSAKQKLIKAVEGEHNKASQDNQSQDKNELDATTSPVKTTTNKRKTFFDNFRKEKQRQKKIIPIHDKHKIAKAFDPCHRSLPSDKEIQGFSELWKNMHMSNQDQGSLPSDKKVQDFSEMWKRKHMPDQNHSFIEPGSIKDSKELQDFIAKLHTKNSQDDTITLDDTAAEVLYKQLQDTNKDTEEDVSTEDFLTWMDRARQNCLELQYLLVSAGGVVNFLNRLMIGFIITLVILLWLLFTKYLRTQTVVVITSPFLAATFIFGDTIKTMFQGIIFAYIMHPFTIGDLCVIDGAQMEVKEIGVWRTLFSKVGTEEEVIMPNSVLKSKAITNCEGQPELVLHDVVEFKLDDATKSKDITNLEWSIKRFFHHQIVVSQSKRVDSEAVKKIIQQCIPGASHRWTERMETKDIKQDELTQHNEIQEENAHDTATMQRTVSEPTGQNEIVHHNIHLTNSMTVPNLHVTFEVQEQGCDDVTVMVKQIEGSIGVAVHFKYRDTVSDMTKAQAYNAKCKWKSDILRETARLISERLRAESKAKADKVDVMAGSAN